MCVRRVHTNGALSITRAHPTVGAPLAPEYIKTHIEMELTPNNV